MNLKTKEKMNLMVYISDNNSISTIGNVFVEVLSTERKVTPVEFNYQIFNKSIPIGAAATDTDLPNGAVTYCLNYTSLIHVEYNYLIFIEQAHEFGVSIHNVDTGQSGKNMYADNRVTSKKLLDVCDYLVTHSSED